MTATNANTQIYDKSIDRAAMLRLYEKRTSGKIELVIEGHKIRVDKLLQESDLKGSGFKGFQKLLQKEISSTFKEARDVHARSLFDLASEQTAFTTNTLNKSIGDVFRVERPSRRIAEEIIINNPLYKNVTLNAGWEGIGINEKKRIEGIIRRGISSGMSEKEIANDIIKGSTFNITRNQAMGLVVTGTTSVYAQVDHSVYEANKDALQGYEYVAVLDSRTTPLCAHRDGNIYPIGDTAHLPPAHWYCRSTTIPVVKSYDSLSLIESIGRIRKRNLTGLSKKQIAWYDGQRPDRETYDQWLRRQKTDVQLRHLGSITKVNEYQKGLLTVDKFTAPNGVSIGIKELRAMSDESFGVPGDSRKFAMAKQKLDTLNIGAVQPEDFYKDTDLVDNLRQYYLLQAGELDGTLSLTNYRGMLVHNKKATKQRVLSTPPTEDNLKFNPVTGRYEDSRMYQPSPSALQNSITLIEEAVDLKKADKDFIKDFISSLENKMSVNERAVVAENLRIVFTRFRNNGELWNNFKAVTNSQIKFDVMNVSSLIETQLRRDANLMSKLALDNYLDPVLGPTQLQDLHDGFISNIFKKNAWEDRTAPKLGRELRSILDLKVPYKLRRRIDENEMKSFYQRFAKRLSIADTPDRDQFAVTIGRDLYNLANYRGSRKEWYDLGVKLLDDANNKGFFTLETMGVQKRRMKSRMSGQYFGPYYDTFVVNMRIVDPRIQEYSQLTRKVELGLRIGVTTDKNRLKIREGFKTYFTQDNRDTRIPIISTSSFGDLPEKFIDKSLSTALNWTAKTEYKIDEDYFDFVDKLLNFQDDKGNAKYYNDLNHFRKYIVERGDAYERFKSMQWLRQNQYSFSNHPFIDHRGRIYDRGLIGPQSGETFRPFLNTKKIANFSKEDFFNFQDQVGSFLGGLSDTLEGRSNSLSQVGRQQIANRWRKDLVAIGNAMMRGKPNDIRFVLTHPLAQEVDSEELAKFYRFAIEAAKIDRHLNGVYTARSLATLSNYKTALALEQDASSSGAQIIALTTKNKQLAELSNVVATNQKRRLYDEIAGATFQDPRFKKLNERLGLTEKDLRKAAKAQNMVTFYGAGEKTGIMNVEAKLGKVLGKQDGVLVVKAAERDTVLSEISAQAARYKEWDPQMYDDLMRLRKDVKDSMNKGLALDDEMMEQLWFLDQKTKDVVEKMSRSYDMVVTPSDFQAIAKIMSEHLAVQVPILKDFTKYFGRLAEDYLLHASSKKADITAQEIFKKAMLGNYKSGTKAPERLSEVLGIRANEAISEKILKRFSWYKPDSTLAELLYGVKDPVDRRSGFTLGKFKVGIGAIKENAFSGIDFFYPNKLPKNWTNVPWVNFDGKVVEQNFTQRFEERLLYKDADGNWITNVLQVDQKTDPTWYEELRNKTDTMNDIADVNKARTAFAVNGNHSNDAVIVKRFHQWGSKTQTPTSTIHDAFFTNVTDMRQSKKALREIFADMSETNVVQNVLDEMKARGLPQELYDAYLNEAIEKGLIPVIGRSKINGHVLTPKDILKREDILQEIDPSFFQNRSWYGIG